MVNFFPCPYPDELLYSTVARYHKYSGNVNVANTMNQLFEFKNIPMDLVLLPRHMEVLNRKIPGVRSYSERDLVINHTLYPYYAFSMSSMNRDHLQHRMIRQGVRRLHFIAEPNPVMNLKICPKCIESDICIVGEPYWRRTHQIPIVNYCAKHKYSLYDCCPACKISFSTHENVLLTVKEYCICGYDLKKAPKQLIYKSEVLQRTSVEVELLLSQWDSIKDNLPKFWNEHFTKIINQSDGILSIANECWEQIHDHAKSMYGDEILSTLGITNSKWIIELFMSYRNPHAHFILFNLLGGSIRSFLSTNNNEKKAA